MPPSWRPWAITAQWPWSLHSSSPILLNLGLYHPPSLIVILIPTLRMYLFKNIKFPTFLMVLFLDMCARVCVSVCMHVHTRARGCLCTYTMCHRGQKRTLALLELEWQAVGSFLRCWEPNPGPPGKQYALLTIESALQLIYLLVSVWLLFQSLVNLITLSDHNYFFCICEFLKLPTQSPHPHLQKCSLERRSLVFPPWPCLPVPWLLWNVAGDIESYLIVGAVSNSHFQL